MMAAEAEVAMKGPFDLTGRRALVTGASRGIGRAIARGLADAGAQVCCVSRSEDALQETVAGSGESAERMSYHVADLRTEEAIGDAALIEHLDRPRVDPAGARAGQRLARAPLHDHDVDPRQRQLGGQHQPGRAGACDHHGVRRHAHTVERG